MRGRNRMLGSPANRTMGDNMAEQPATGYLPGDPRYGLQGEALKDYYRTKAAQWAIYCWDKPSTADTRRALLPEQKAYLKNFGERVIGYGHFVSDDGRDTLGTSFFMQLDDRAAADAFVAGKSMNKAGATSKVEIHRWSNSFGKRAADYRRKGMQPFLCRGRRPGPTSSSASTYAHEGTSRRLATASFSADRSARRMARTISAQRCCWSCRTARRRTSSGTRSRFEERGVSKGREDREVGVWGLSRRLECRISDGMTVLRCRGVRLILTFHQPPHLILWALLSGEDS